MTSERREWVLRAACRGAADWKLAFGRAEDQLAFVERYCRGCWVKQECFDFGKDDWGVYGGLTEKKRSDLLGRRGERNRGLSRVGRTA
jgi:hypothetical protein